MTTHRPLVAIITPVYNGSPWLERTMACVQRQTYSNVVHVVLDNCSTDDTPAVIERFRGGKVPLQVTRNEHALKQIDNWNAAFKLTPPEAKYVMLMCADDLVRPDAVEKLVAQAEKDPNIVLVAAGDVAHDRVCLPYPPEGKSIVDGKAMIRAILDGTYNHFAWQCFFARWRPEEAAQDFFVPGPAAFDNHKLLKIMTRGKVAFVREPLIYTRHHAATMSKQMSKSRDPKQRLWRWEAAMDYANSVLSPTEAKRCFRDEKFFVARFEFFWRLRGFKASADALRDRLKTDGHPLAPLDWLAAFLHYPGYKFRQWSRQRAANGEFSSPISENLFTEAGQLLAPKNTQNVAFSVAHDASGAPANAGR